MSPKRRTFLSLVFACISLTFCLEIAGVPPQSFRIKREKNIHAAFNYMFCSSELAGDPLTSDNLIGCKRITDNHAA